MKKIINIIVCGFLVLGFSSCLKDKNPIGPDANGAIKNVLEFKNVGAIKSVASAPYSVFIPFTLNPKDATAEFEAAITYAGSEVAPEDIVVNLTVDPSIIATYNGKVADAAYSALATGTYSFPATVTIPKGQREVTFKIAVKPSMFNAAVENALPIKISSASTGVISGSFGAVIYSMPLASIWQGTYHVYINNNYGSIDANIGNFDEADVKLETVGPNKLQVLYIARTYSGNVQYQFNGNNTSITSVKAFSGATTYVTSIQSIDVIDPVNGIFELHWTFAGRGIVERWVKQK